MLRLAKLAQTHENNTATKFARFHVNGCTTVKNSPVKKIFRTVRVNGV